MQQLIIDPFTEHKYLRSSVYFNGILLSYKVVRGNDTWNLFSYLVGNTTHSVSEEQFSLLLYLRSLFLAEYQHMLKNEKIFTAFRCCCRFLLHYMQTVSKFLSYLSKIDCEDHRLLVESFLCLWKELNGSLLTQWQQ